MENNKLKDKISSTLNTEVPDVLSKIKQDPNFRVPPKAKGFTFRNLLKRRMALSLTSLFIVAILVITVSNRTSDVVASTITLELNPSIEIALNDDDIVISVTALNDDGNEVIQSNIEYKGLNVDEVLELLVARLYQLGYVVTTSDENNIILIQVQSDDENLQLRLEMQLKIKLQTELGKYSNSNWILNIKDLKLTNDQKVQVKESSLLSKYSMAKIALVYRIQFLDNNYTRVDLARLSIRDLYDIYFELESPDNLPERDKMPPSRRGNQNQ